MCSQPSSEVVRRRLGFHDRRIEKLILCLEMQVQPKKTVEDGLQVRKLQEVTYVYFPGFCFLLT